MMKSRTSQLDPAPYGVRANIRGARSGAYAAYPRSGEEEHMPKATVAGIQRGSTVG